MILHRDVFTPIVAVTVTYHVGSKNEHPSRTGFAHFFEHLLFEGSKNIKRGEFFEYVTDAGGAINANTSFDRTFYYEVLPSNQLKLGLWLESERMLHAHISQEGISTQREVVKEEKRQRYDNQPYGSFFSEMYKRAFKEHPYRWIPIGSIEHLNQASLEEFVEFYETFYTPNNATLSIAGDLDIKQTKKWIEQYFEDIPSSIKDIPRPNIVEPAQIEERRDIIYDNIQLPGVFYGYHMPVQGSEDYYSFQILSLLLSGGQSSRVYKTLVDKDQSAVFAGSFPLATEDPGLYLAYAIANAGVDVNVLDKALDKEIALVRSDLVSEYEFQKVLNRLERQFIESRSGMANIAENLANYQMYFGDANLINNEFERYRRITREDIRNVAAKYLVPKNRVVLHYLPISEKEKGEKQEKGEGK